MLNGIKTLSTLGRLKEAIKECKKLYVWCNWQGDDGDYIEVSKAAFLRSINANTPNDGAHGGRIDETQADFRVEQDCVYVN